MSISAALPAQNKQEENFPLSQESLQRAEGVEPGEMLQFAWNESRIFPGTRRTIKVYVPRAYDGKTPACVAVFQDGGGYKFETVFDNLIHSKEMPVTIAVIVPPGSVPGAVDPSGKRHNRTFEYDSPGDRYARFLLGEILPAAERLKTADGRAVKLSHSGNDRMIAGGSSGAAAAFNAAWAMPEEFSRVFSTVGSYTGLRGSYVYPTLVHKTEPKALRLFLQSGTRDMWTAFGDWWSANNAMVRALSYAGYEFEHEFGDGKHSGAHGTALFPRAMRFLWKDWPAPVRTSVKSKNHVLNPALPQDKKWAALPGDFPNARIIRADAGGGVFVSTAESGVARYAGLDKNAGRVEKGLLWAFDKDGVTRITSNGGTIERVTANGKRTELAKNLPPTGLVATASGDVYISTGEKIWLLKTGQKPVLVDEGLRGVTALAVSGDGNWLAAFENDTTRGFSYRIETDGSLNYKQTFYVLHKQDDDDAARSRDAAAEASDMGFLYVATALGVQICDANGRCGAILPLPRGVAAVSLCFGGPDFKTLHVLGADGKIYTRPIKNGGATAFRPAKPILMRAG